MKKTEKSIEIGGRKLTLSTGHVAGQATSAVMASYGETVVLVTVVARDPKEDWGYFPLHVEYQERLYAGGKIKGSRWVKREGKPTDDEILTARLIDRSIRPLFPKSYKKEVQIIITVLSVDLESSPDIPAGVAVSAALASSPIPWNGPVGTTKVGFKDGVHTINPVAVELKKSDMELVVSSTKDALVMIEAGANEIPEKEMLEGISFAQKENKTLIDFINDFAKVVGVKKQVFQEVKYDKGLEKSVKDLASDKIKDLVSKMADKRANYDDYDEAKAAVADNVSEKDRKLAKDIFDNLFAQDIRKILLSGKRPDGRKPDEIRPLSAQVTVLPRTHGSAIFNRGNTQALTIATLGASSLEQLIETAEGEESKRYIHHYSMPPYSTGETGRVGWPKRREIGHGALAEKALLPVIPSKDDFPYTIRVVTEILSSNGSTSMAATCGSTLSLMDAGVPIRAAVAGIAVGAIIESPKEFVVLTDIVGIEDGGGDIDFKVAGTEKGITALQLDVKSLKLTLPILKEAFTQAKKAREEILKVMLSTIKTARSKVSVYAPKIKLIKIDPRKIGEVIGPGGKTIKGIIAKTGAQVDVDDDGTVSVSAVEEKSVDAAIQTIEALTREVQAGEIYEGEVKRIEQFGVFVEVLPGKDGLVHISDMREEYVENPTDVVSLGDKVKVRVKEIDNLGRINLSMLLDKDADSRKRARPRRNDMNSGPSRGGYSRNRMQHRDSGGGRPQRRYANFGRPQARTSGPHFPTSRFLKDSQDFSGKRR